MLGKLRGGERPDCGERILSDHGVFMVPMRHGVSDPLFQCDIRCGKFREVCPPIRRERHRFQRPIGTGNQQCNLRLGGRRGNWPDLLADMDRPRCGMETRFHLPNAWILGRGSGDYRRSRTANPCGEWLWSPQDKRGAERCRRRKRNTHERNSEPNQAKDIHVHAF